MGGISRTSYLSALGSQACTILFSSDMSFLLGFDPFLGSLWILSHIGKKCAPCMPYKLLGKGMVYHYYTCVVVVQACLALRCWQQNCAGVKPISATRQALGLRWKSPKRTILEMGTALKKRIFVGGISRTSYLSALRSQARTILFSSDMSFLHRFDPFLGSLWILSHIGKKCAPCMPYKLLGKGM